MSRSGPAAQTSALRQGCDTQDRSLWCARVLPCPAAAHPRSRRLL